MKRSKTVPDYLINSIVRHVTLLLNNEKRSIKYINAERLIKKEIIKLQNYKKNI